MKGRVGRTDTPCGARATSAGAPDDQSKYYPRRVNPVNSQNTRDNLYTRIDVERRPSSCNQFVRTNAAGEGLPGCGELSDSDNLAFRDRGGAFQLVKGAISTGGRQIQRFAPLGSGNTETEPVSSDSQSAKCDGEIPGLSLGRSVQWQSKDTAKQNASLRTRVRADNPATAASTLRHGSKDGN